MKAASIISIFIIIGLCGCNSTTPIPDSQPSLQTETEKNIQNHISIGFEPTAYLDLGKGDVPDVNTILPCEADHEYVFGGDPWTREQVVDSLRAYYQFAIKHGLETPIPIDSSLNFLSSENYHIDSELHYIGKEKLWRHFLIYSEEEYLILSYGFLCR